MACRTWSKVNGLQLVEVGPRSSPGSSAAARDRRSAGRGSSTRRWSLDAFLARSGFSRKLCRCQSSTGTAAAWRSRWSFSFGYCSRNFGSPSTLARQNWSVVSHSMRSSASWSGRLVAIEDQPSVTSPAVGDDRAGARLAAPPSRPSAGRPARRSSRIGSATSSTARVRPRRAVDPPSFLSFPFLSLPFLSCPEALAERSGSPPESSANDA